MNEKELLDKLALMFNKLDAGYVIPYLDNDIIYKSQTTGFIFRGKPRVESFLKQVCKGIKSFKKKNYLLIGALSPDPDGGKPYLLLGHYSDHGSKESKVTIKTKKNLIKEIEIQLLAYTGDFGDTIQRKN